jgi:hypothetical protein
VSWVFRSVCVSLGIFGMTINDWLVEIWVEPKKSNWGRGFNDPNVPMYIQYRISVADFTDVRSETSPNEG